MPTPKNAPYKKVQRRNEERFSARGQVITPWWDNGQRRVRPEGERKLTKAEKITAKEAEFAETNRAITSIDMAEGQRRRVEELKSREKELARMFEASERTLYLIEQFQRVIAARVKEGSLSL